MGTTSKTAGQIAYEEDIRHCPTYSDGKLRRDWQALGAVEKWSWERNPTARDYKAERAA